MGSDDERPPTRAAPAESPARESLRPASKKKKLNQLDEGEEFEVTVTLDESVYGAGSVSVQMKRDDIPRLRSRTSRPGPIVPPAVLPPAAAAAEAYYIINACAATIFWSCRYPSRQVHAQDGA